MRNSDPGLPDSTLDPERLSHTLQVSHHREDQCIAHASPNPSQKVQMAPGPVLPHRGNTAERSHSLLSHTLVPQSLQVFSELEHKANITK